MNNIDFLEKITKILNDEEWEQVLKKAMANGFTVPGYKTIWKAPRKKVLSKTNLNIKQRNGSYNGGILLEAIKNSDFKKHNNVDISSMVSKWNTIEHREEIEEELQKLLVEIEQKENETEIFVEKENTSEKGEKDKKIEEVLEKNNVLREKNRSLQQSLNGKIIEIDKMKQTILRLQRDNDKIQKEKENLQRENSNYAELINDLQNEFKEKENYIEEILQELEELRNIKRNVAKILCFSKRQVEAKIFVDYDVITVASWNEIKARKIEVNSFDELWFVHQGFQYGFFLDVKECYNGTFREFRNVERLKYEMGGL